MVMETKPSFDAEGLDLLVRYSLDNDESMTEAVVNAFLAANVDVFDKSNQLADWIKPGVLENIRWSSDRPLHLWTRIWDHVVVITPEEVSIYSRR